ncbi:MAG: ATP-binding cassette domain-containing protein [Acidobacteriota bacterium]
MTRLVKRSNVHAETSGNIRESSIEGLHPMTQDAGLGVRDGARTEAGDGVLLRARSIVKVFGAVVALNGVDLDVNENEIVGLVGDNGAGKTTLIQILSGNFPPDEGEIEFDGQPVHFASPAEARHVGIETVYQDLSLCPNLDSTANLFIGRERCRSVLGLSFLQRGEMEKEAAKLIRDLDIDLPSVRTRVDRLSGGQRQAVSLARFVAWGRKLVLLDEPTAALGVRETAKALDLVEKLHRDTHVSMILISHNLQHVFRIADRIVVLRHGEVAGSRVTAQTTPDEIVSLITGADLMTVA